MTKLMLLSSCNTRYFYVPLRLNGLYDGKMAPTDCACPKTILEVQWPILKVFRYGQWLYLASFKSGQSIKKHEIKTQSLGLGR